MQLEQSDQVCLLSSYLLTFFGNAAIRGLPDEESFMTSEIDPSQDPVEKAAALSPEEMRFFAAHGYVVKRNILDHALCDRAVDLVWTCFPRSFERNDPATWRGKVHDCMGDLHLYVRMGRVKLKSEVDGSTLLYEVLPGNENVQNVVRQLLGPDTYCPGIRGIRSIFPTPKLLPLRPRPHIEGHPLQVGVVGYLDDVPENGGAFQVWPGSHVDFYRACDSKICVTPNIHGPSINHSKRIRMAAICDFKQPHVVRLISQKPSDDVWEDWPNVGSHHAGQGNGVTYPVPSELSPGRRLYNLIWMRGTDLKLNKIYRSKRGYGLKIDRDGQFRVIPGDQEMHQWLAYLRWCEEAGFKPDLPQDVRQKVKKYQLIAEALNT
jgi:hypothetical protein